MSAGVSEAVALEIIAVAQREVSFCRPLDWDDLESFIVSYLFDRVRTGPVLSMRAQARYASRSYFRDALKKARHRKTALAADLDNHSTQHDFEALDTEKDLSEFSGRLKPSQRTWLENRLNDEATDRPGTGKHSKNVVQMRARSFFAGYIERHGLKNCEHGNAGRANGPARVKVRVN